MISDQHVAIIDIGSNAARLVIYDSLDEAPFKIHNERIICNLGADLSKTNRISKENFQKGIDALARFSKLIKTMNIKVVRAVATAAIRDADNGREFIEQVRKDYNFNIDILDGDDEARLSAQGVMCNGMGQDGIIGDFGGGSLELIVVENSEVKNKVSMPIGSHRLLSEPNKGAVIKKVNAELDKLDFLNDFKGKSFYALGGSWRSMAKAHIHMISHPIKTLDHYMIEYDKALDFIKLLSKQNPATIEKIIGVQKKRVRDMGVAAIAMLELFKRIEPKNVIFSGTGLREGLLFEQLPENLKTDDLMLASCKKLVTASSRFKDTAVLENLYEWIKPLFASRSKRDLRLIKASCYLSDVSLYEHEEYQAEHALERILVMPFYDISHEERAFLALVQHVRYKGFYRHNYKGKAKTEPVARIVNGILNNDDVNLAFAIGMAIHMAYLLTAGELSLLKDSKFVINNGNIKFEIADDSKIMYVESVEVAFQRIAEILDLKI